MRFFQKYDLFPFFRNLYKNSTLPVKINRVYYKIRMNLNGVIDLKKLKSLSPALKKHAADSALAPTFKFLEVVFLALNISYYSYAFSEILSNFGIYNF